LNNKACLLNYIVYFYTGKYNYYTMAKTKFVKSSHNQSKTSIRSGVLEVKEENQYYTSGIIFIGAKEKPENQMTPLEKMEKLKLGLSKLDLVKLKSRTELDYDKLSKALSVTRATLIKKKGEQKFSSALSERMIGLADIYSYGYAVFEDEAKFNQWMFRPNQALGGKSPYDVIDNQFGREEVKNIIGRIEYGVYS
jgi:putative toxin-antitoxin system antitoxin component (TIGR02293 family)